MDAAQNAMDNIEVRPLKFSFDDIEARDPVWSRTHPLFSIYINALAIHVPYFERYLGQAFRRCKPDVGDPELAGDISSIIGQEAHHARNFIAFNRFMVDRYPAVERLDASAKAGFERSLEEDSRKQQLGFIAGYETFTYLGGMIILDGYDKWMKDADPVLRSMWVWHQVEEVEHGSVAFNVYRHFYGDAEWYRKWMVLKAYAHIGLETLRAYVPMCRREGYFRNPLRAAKALGFYFRFSLQLGRAALPVLLKRYHPRNHPRCSDRQNPLAVAWRHRYMEGEDVLQLNNELMESIDRPVGAAAAANERA